MSENETNHTELPWKTYDNVRGLIGIFNSKDECVVPCRSELTKENANMIVRAANSHYDLLEALRAARLRMLKYGESREEIAEMDAVIARAEGR